MNPEHPYGLEITVALASLAPVLQSGTYVFAAVFHNADAYEALKVAKASFAEDEGLSLIVPRTEAVRLGMIFDQTLRQITLMVPSQLDGVGLSVLASKALADRGIPASVVAATHHDHIFVPSRRVDEAMEALRALQRDAQRLLDAVPA